VGTLSGEQSPGEVRVARGDREALDLVKNGLDARESHDDVAGERLLKPR
jgi:hypothetical protein